MANDLAAIRMGILHVQKLRLRGGGTSSACQKLVTKCAGTGIRHDHLVNIVVPENRENKQMTK